MDSILRASQTFIMEIPSLVFVGRETLQPNQVGALYYHPATIPLIAEVGVDFHTTRPVTSNSKAAAAALIEPNSVAITNDLCARHYGLTVYKTLRAAINMPWTCFTSVNAMIPRSLRFRYEP